MNKQNQFPTFTLDDVVKIFSAQPHKLTASQCERVYEALVHHQCVSVLGGKPTFWESNIKSLKDQITHANKLKKAILSFTPYFGGMETNPRITVLDEIIKEASDTIVMAKNRKLLSDIQFDVEQFMKLFEELGIKASYKKTAYSDNDPYESLFIDFVEDAFSLLGVVSNRGEPYARGSIADAFKSVRKREKSKKTK